MQLDSLTLLAITKEINRMFGGQPVTAVRQLDSTTIAITVAATTGGWGHIVVGIHPSAPFVAWTRGRREGLKEPVPFVKSLRAWLDQSTFNEAVQKDFDRLVFLRFANQEKAESLTLICEIMGHRSNVVAVHEDTGLIRDAWKRIPASLNRVRQILPGLPYQPPPLQGRVNPFSLRFEEVRDRLSALTVTLEEGLRQSFTGMSPHLIALLLHGSNLSPSTPISSMQEEDWERLLASWNRLTIIAQSSSFQPVRYPNPTEKVSLIYPIPLPQPTTSGEPLAEMGPTIFSLAQQIIQEAAERQAREGLLRSLRQQWDQLTKKIAKLEQEQQMTCQFVLYRKYGEALLSHLHAIPKDARLVELPDPEDPTAVLTIRIQEGLTPSQAAAEYFETYKRLKRAHQAIPQALSRLAKEKSRLETLLKEAEQLQGPALVNLTKAVQPPAPAPAPRKKEKPVPFLRKKVGERYEVWLGRNQEENRLLLRAAAPHDLWFHTKGAPGGHGLLKRDKKDQSVPSHIIQEAARLVAAHSSRRTSQWVEVDYTEARYVRPIKGKVGQVLYTHFKTVAVRPQIREKSPTDDADESEEG